MVNCIKSLRNYHLYGKPGNSGQSSNGTVHPGGDFPENKYYISRYYIFPVFTDTTDRARLHLERERKIYRYFVNGTTQSRSSFLCQTKYQYHLTEIFSPKLSYKW